MVQGCHMQDRVGKRLLEDCADRWKFLRKELGQDEAGVGG